MPLPDWASIGLPAGKRELAPPGFASLNECVLAILTR
jgi:hypothetical protein